MDDLVDEYMRLMEIEEELSQKHEIQCTNNEASHNQARAYGVWMM